MTMLLPMTCWMIGVIGWNVYQRVTLIGSLPEAGVTLLHPAPRLGGGYEPKPQRGPFADPLSAVLGSELKIQLAIEADFDGRPSRVSPLGSSPIRPAWLSASF